MLNMIRNTLKLCLCLNTFFPLNVSIDILTQEGEGGKVAVMVVCWPRLRPERRSSRCGGFLCGQHHRHLFTRRHTRLLCSEVARQQPGSISHNNSRVTGINVRYSCDFNLTACINQQLDLVVCNVWWELQRYPGEGLYISAR